MPTPTNLGPDYWTSIWKIVTTRDLGSLGSLAKSIPHVFIPDLREKIEQSELRRLKMEDGATGSAQGL